MAHQLALSRGSDVALWHSRRSKLGHVHAYVRVCVRVPSCVRVCVHAYVRVCVRVPSCVRICVYAPSAVCVCVYVPISGGCQYTRLCACVYASPAVCVKVYAPISFASQCTRLQLCAYACTRLQLMRVCVRTYFVGMSVQGCAFVHSACAIVCASLCT